MLICKDCFNSTEDDCSLALGSSGFNQCEACGVLMDCSTEEYHHTGAEIRDRDDYEKLKEVKDVVRAVREAKETPCSCSKLIIMPDIGGKCACGRLPKIDRANQKMNILFQILLKEDKMHPTPRHGDINGKLAEGHAISQLKANVKEVANITPTKNQFMLHVQHALTFVQRLFTLAKVHVKNGCKLPPEK